MNKYLQENTFRLLESDDFSCAIEKMMKKREIYLKNHELCYQLIKEFNDEKKDVLKQV